MDTRHLDQKRQDALRQRGVAMVRDGKSQAAVARELGVRPATVSAWMKAAGATTDVQRLASKPRGPRHGRTPIEWAKVTLSLRSAPPRQLKLRLRHDIWTIAAVTALLKSPRYGVTASRWMVADHIYQAVLPNHPPEQRVPSWRPESLFAWRDGELDEVKAVARAAGAALWFLAGVSQDMVNPPVNTGDDDDRPSSPPYFMSAFSVRRQLAFLGFSGSDHRRHLAVFCSHLGLHVDGPVHLVVDERIACMSRMSWLMRNGSGEQRSPTTFISRPRIG